MGRILLIALAALGLALPAARAAEAPLIADLSKREIEITTRFTGADLLLFGTTDVDGDVVIVVRGPTREVEVRAKQRVAGIWVNGEAVRFRDVPGFYHVASSRPLDEIARPEIFSQLQIGIGALRLEPEKPVDPAVEDAYRGGLIRVKQGEALYVPAPGEVTILGGRLFRATIGFPTAVPTGDYIAKVYLFRGGVPVSSSETPLIVRRGGLEAAIFRFAHEHSAFYGIVAIVIALVAGWLAGALFRKA